MMLLGVAWHNVRCGLIDDIRMERGLDSLYNLAFVHCMYNYFRYLLTDICIFL